MDNQHSVTFPFWVNQLLVTHPFWEVSHLVSIRQIWLFTETKRTNISITKLFILFIFYRILDQEHHGVHSLLSHRRPLQPGLQSHCPVCGLQSSPFEHWQWRRHFSPQNPGGHPVNIQITTQLNINGLHSSCLHHHINVVVIIIIIIDSTSLRSIVGWTAASQQHSVTWS